MIKTFTVGVNKRSRHGLVTVAVYRRMRTMAQKDIYHEKQCKQLCALHTLNNLFQSGQAFSKGDLDRLCEHLSPHSWVNPHRSILGIGNYDVNILIAALQQKDYDMKWWDKRRSAAEIPLATTFGLILNKSSPSRIATVTLPFKSKHWIAIRSFDGVYYNLDSKLASPSLIGEPSRLLDFLKRYLDRDDSELFLVTKASVESTVASPLAKVEDHTEQI